MRATIFNPHQPAHRRSNSWRCAPVIAFLAALLLVAASLAGTVLGPVAADAGTARHLIPRITLLSVQSGGTWGSDLVTIRGSGFAGSGTRAVSAVRFGDNLADGFTVVNPSTIQAYTPEISNKLTITDVQIVLRDATVSPLTAADRFTFVIPTIGTPINGHWTAAQAGAIGNSMIGRAPVLNAQAVAPNPGHWTPAMGVSAVQRAAGWLGMPYAWAGGTYSGPSAGSCSGGGPDGQFDCLYEGFDCSGLVLYAWAKYQHLAHLAATQLGQAGTYHPGVAELQPGDLMFFSGGGPIISHVVMYAGKGIVIQSSESGWPVRYSSLADVLSSHGRYFGATRPMSLGIQGNSPTVTSVSIRRSATSGGSSITIHGTDLDTTSTLYFGGKSTYGFSIENSSTITATIPPSPAGTSDVVVDNAWGESPVSSAASVTYINRPIITAVSPPSAVTVAGSTVVITGKDFYPGARVYFGKTAGTSVHVLSSRKIIVTVPRHAVGTVALQVTTAYGSSNTRRFTYNIAPAPAPTAAAPTTPAPTSPAPTSPAPTVMPTAAAPTTPVPTTPVPTSPAPTAPAPTS